MRIFIFTCILFIIYFFHSPIDLSAQDQDTSEIEILNANTLEFNKEKGEELRKLVGDVILLHNGTKMYCDSALIYANQNLVDAYSNVFFNRGDTLKLYGDYLKYNGNTSLGNIRNNVRLIEKKAVLTTDFLDFDTKENIAYYYNGGEINSDDNNIKSISGTYYSNTKLFFLKDSVILYNPDYTMYTDTFKYHTELKTAYFLGPTTIISDSTRVYCEYGWYNTATDISQYCKNAVVKDSKGKTLKADTLYYDKLKGFGRAVNNIDFFDSTKNVVLRGNYSVYKKDPEFLLITDSALLIRIMDKDSLFFHADTLKSEYDPSGAYRIISAYHKVKFYKSDFQGKCDSLTYNFNDSIIRMYKDPVLWSGENQMTAEFIRAYTKNNEINYMEFDGPAFIISQEDTLRFNQIKGKNMFGYFENNDLVKILVKGNAESIYFPKDESKIIGINKSESSELVILMKENKIDRIRYVTKPAATLYPLKYVQSKDLIFKGFKWLDKHRPKDKEDVFHWNGK